TGDVDLPGREGQAGEGDAQAVDLGAPPEMDEHLRGRGNQDGGEDLAAAELPEQSAARVERQERSLLLDQDRTARDVFEVLEEIHPVVVEDRARGRIERDDPIVVSQEDRRAGVDELARLVL